MTDPVKLVVDILTVAMPDVAVYGDELEEGHDPGIQAAIVVAARGGTPQRPAEPHQGQRPVELHTTTRGGGRERQGHRGQRRLWIHAMQIITKKLYYIYMN